MFDKMINTCLVIVITALASKILFIGELRHLPLPPPPLLVELEGHGYAPGDVAELERKYREVGR